MRDGVSELVDSFASHGLTYEDFLSRYVRLRRIKELLSGGVVDEMLKADRHAGRGRSNCELTALYFPGWPGGLLPSGVRRQGGVGMKVVLFCGGLGMRMRDGVTNAPKPMAMIGDRPLLWHVMRYYAHYGHRDFVLCLGYGHGGQGLLPELRRTRSNDFVLEGAGKVELFKTDISDWRITFVDTGLHSEIGERLRRVRRFVEGEEMFLANYADVFTDAPLPDMISRFAASDAAVSLLAVPPQSSHHVRRRRRQRGHHPVSCRCGNCASGRTAGTSSSGPSLRLPGRR